MINLEVEFQWLPVSRFSVSLALTWKTVKHPLTYDYSVYSNTFCKKFL